MRFGHGIGFSLSASANSIRCGREELPVMNDVLTNLAFKALSAMLAISALFLFRDLFFPSLDSSRDESEKVRASYRQRVGKSINNLLGFFKSKH